VVVFVSATGGASAQSYLQTGIALEGDTAPGTGGGTYSSFGIDPSINTSGDVAFLASVTGGTALSGIFVDSGGTDTAVALVGDTAPGTGGGTYSSLAGPSVNASGDVAFWSFMTGGTALSGIFVDSGGTDTAVALVGDTAPGTGGGTYSSFGIDLSINASGDVAFSASLTGGSASAGIFVDSGGTDTAVALQGDSAPGTGGGTYTFLSSASINASGDVMFSSPLTGGSASAGIFVDSGGTDAAVALDGDTAPGTGGGIYAGFFDPSINASGDVAFIGSVTSGTAFSGVFVDSGGTDTAVSLDGDSAPGTGGGTYSSFVGASINVFGDVAFRGFPMGGTVFDGIFVDSGGTDTAVALGGGTAPGTGGGTYAGFSNPSINASREVAFTGFATGGTVSQGIFKAVPFVASVPALGAHGQTVAALALAVAGALAALRHSRRHPVILGIKSDVIS
jgi:hypothetical protein